MGRLAWIIGELVVGLLASGLLAAFAVLAAGRAGFGTEPWVMWATWLGAGIVVLLSFLVGERMWRRRKARRAA
jgi:hypothetical protein